MASSQVTDMQRHSVADAMSVGKDSNVSRGMTHNPSLRSDYNKSNLHQVAEEGSDDGGTPQRVEGADDDQGEYPSMQDLIEEAKQKDDDRERLRSDVNLADST